MRFVPSVAGSITLAAAKEDTKFAVSNVEYQELGDNRFKAVATDCKILAILEGKCPDADLHPAHDKLAASPNGCPKTLIPADVFARVMKTMKVGKSHPKRAVLETTGIAASAKEKQNPEEPDVNTVTFITSDGKGERVEQIQAEQPRFPDCNWVIPKKAPAFRIKVPIDQIMKLLTIAGKVGEHVTLDFYSSEKPVILKTENGDLSFLGLCMPCNLGKSEELANEEETAVEPAISSKRFDRGGPYEHETD
jgi:hypothetical protein